ncbi:hypothetical protein ACFPJ4_04985 [Lysinimonas soli]|uniref:DUF1330 domain-containing protein n=1 Tax=Lysinimonas soli TaxID=1074233 RepID=A0ABW0NNH6_9MICO
MSAADAAGPVELCVLLWAHPGHDAELVAYEDRVLALVPAHGGRVLQRARSSGESGHPLEVQFYSFPSEAALQAYLADDRRVALAAERDRVVARTEFIRVSFS